LRLLVPTGTAVYLGKPAKPLDSGLGAAIAGFIGSFPEVQEAHLPQCWAKGIMREAAQVLVVVLTAEASEPRAAQAIDSGVSRLLPRGTHLDVWLITSDHSLLGAVRKADCRIVKGKALA